jgi:ribosome maturation factor RimP
VTAGEFASLVRPLIVEEGFELVECSVSRRQRHQHFRVSIDREDGVPVEACARISRKISNRLDENPMLRGQYRIEVSSPGMNRPVRTLDHFRRFEGERVRIELAEPGKGPRVLIGTIGTVEGEKEGFWFRPDQGEDRFLSLGEIGSARLRMDPWKRRTPRGGAPGAEGNDGD